MRIPEKATMTITAPASIWVHVTTLMNWTRPPVGVVRVEQEYCRWLLARMRQQPAERIRFCEFDRLERRFVEVSPDDVAARLQHSGSGKMPEGVPLRLRVKHVLRSAIPYLPTSWVSPLRKAFRAGVHGIRAAYAGVSGMLAGQHDEAADKDIFEPGDRWVSLGLDWVHLDQQLFLELKTRLALKTTFICYDVIPVLFPQFVLQPPQGFEAYLTLMAKYSDAVLCISEHARRDYVDVLTRWGVKVPPTHVIRLGSEIRRGEAAVESIPPGLQNSPGDRPFVLFVSTIEPRKNHAVLYRAWTRLRERGVVPHRLVCVGMQSWGVDQLLKDVKEDARIAGDIQMLEHVTDAELAWLYHHAAFTVYPSLYEGWGLPVAESLARGKFCLASNASSLPEAGGAWAEYLDPMDAQAWEDRLAWFMAHPQEVAARNERIAGEYRAPTWAATCATIHGVALTTA
jgi:glycosyltransferase involved in cell wall biosynthesis